MLSNNYTLFRTGTKFIPVSLDSHSFSFFFILPDLPASAQFPATIHPAYHIPILNSYPSKVSPLLFLIIFISSIHSSIGYN